METTVYIRNFCNFSFLFYKAILTDTLVERICFLCCTKNAKKTDVLFMKYSIDKPINLLCKSKSDSYKYAAYSS